MIHGKDKIILGIVAVVVLVFGGLFLFGAESRSESATQGVAVDHDVLSIPDSMHPQGLNFVFFSDGYLSWNEFDNDIQILMEQLRSIEPWKSYDRYNVYKIKPDEVGICEVKTENERKPTLRCDAEKINRYLSQIQTGHFKLITLSRRDFQSWANVSRLTDSAVFFSIPQSPRDEVEKGTQGILFAHMMGHAFGLKDEEIFVIAKADSAAHAPDGPNCAPGFATALSWWGDLAEQYDSVGFFPGCASKEEYIKPTKSSLMNLNDLSQFDPAFGYGPVSERYLRKVLDYCFSGQVYSVSDDPGFFEHYPEFRECIDG